MLLPLLLLLLPSGTAGQCEQIRVVETIPDNLTFSQPITTLPTTAALLKLLDLTEQQLDIAEFYFTLRPAKLPGDGSERDGAEVYKGLLSKGLALRQSGGSIRVVHNTPDHSFPDNDTSSLARAGAIDLRYLDVEALLGAGIIHTKLWVSDGKHFYLGSANMDWQSLRQVKELGLMGVNCPTVAADLLRMFEIYWYLAANPLPVPPGLWDTPYNLTHPMELQLSGEKEPLEVFLVSSPPPFCTLSRTGDITGLLHVLNSAKTSISIEVMDYFPLIMYVKHPHYWSVIDDALRHAAFDRGVRVSLLVSHFSKSSISNPDMYHYLASLAALNGTARHYSGRVSVEVRLLQIPAFTPAQAALRYARVNHAKFVVTDGHVYVSTSNWSGDYFTNTAGISMVVARGESCALCDQVEGVFRRDWGSRYAQPLQPWGSDDDDGDGDVF